MSDVMELRKLMKGHSLVNNKVGAQSDQQKGLPQPPFEKPFDKNTELIPLPPPIDFIVPKNEIAACIKDRISHRKFSIKPISLDQLSFLLWATQGVKFYTNNNSITKRTVPSAGSRHAFETYLAVLRVEGIKPGIYRYIATQHKLLLVREKENLDKDLVETACNQLFCGQAAVTFFWAAIPYRTEWRYTSHAFKVILIDAGHVCQNLYIACEALGIGTCAIAAYFQEKADSLLGIDGKDEYVVYLSPVGWPELSNNAT